MDPTSRRTTYINTTEEEKAKKSIKRPFPFSSSHNIRNKQRKATHPDAKRYAEPGTAIKVFFCDDEKDDISGIIRDFVPFADPSDISQLSEREMFSEAKSSTPSFLYLSPNIKSHVLYLVRKLASISPGKEKSCVFMQSSANNFQEETMIPYPRPNVRKYTRDLDPFSRLKDNSSFVTDKEETEAISKEQWIKRSAAAFYGSSTFQAYQSTGNTDTILSQVTKESVVEIFSRSAESNYRWLKRLLEPRVRHVEGTYISSNSNMQFMQAIRQCNFGILYHTSTSGRINITDVPDSMYDEELKHLSAVLGKKNVVVVVDDLGNNSDQERRKILQYQPTIAQYAKDLILITKADKKAIIS